MTAEWPKERHAVSLFLEHAEYHFEQSPYLLAVVELVGAEAAAEADEGCLYPALPCGDVATVGEETPLLPEGEGCHAEAEHPADDELGGGFLYLEEFVDRLGDEDDSTDECDEISEHCHDCCHSCMILSLLLVSVVSSVVFVAGLLAVVFALHFGALDDLVALQ